MDLLNRHESTQGHQELFLPQRRLTPGIAGCNDYPRFIETHGAPPFVTRPLRVFSYLDGLYSRPGAIGFKLMYSQMRLYPEILLYLAIRRVRIVHLVRRNQLDVIVSDELAKITGASHIVAGQTAEIPMVSLNAATLVDRLARLEGNLARARRLIRWSTCQFIEVTYESLLESEQDHDRIRSFLGIRAGALTAQSNLVRRGARSHRDAIMNYDEVTTALTGTPYLPLLK